MINVGRQLSQEHGQQTDRRRVTRPLAFIPEKLALIQSDHRQSDRDSQSLVGNPSSRMISIETDNRKTDLSDGGTQLKNAYGRRDRHYTLGYRIHGPGSRENFGHEQPVVKPCTTRMVLFCDSHTRVPSCSARLPLSTSG